MGQKTNGLIVLLSIIVIVSAAFGNETYVPCNEMYTTSTGIQCLKCPPGYYKDSDCGVNGTQASCAQCDKMTYQPGCTAATSCAQCRRVCLQNMNIKSLCTPTSDIGCECENGTFKFTEMFCLRHRMCESGTGVKILGNSSQDTICEPCEPGISFSDSSSYHACSLCSKCEEYQTKCTVNHDAVCRENSLTSAYVNISLPIISTTLLLVVLLIYCQTCKRHGSRSCLPCRKQRVKEFELRLRGIVDHDTLYARRRHFRENLNIANSHWHSIFSEIEITDTVSGYQERFSRKPDINLPTATASKSVSNELERESGNKINIKREGKSVGCFLEVETEQNGRVLQQSSENNLPEILNAASPGFLTLESFTLHDGKEAKRSSTKSVNRNASNRKTKPKDVADIQGNKTEPVSNVAIVPPMEIRESFKTVKTGVHRVNRQTDKLTLTGDKNENEAKESEDWFEIDWIKVFKELVPSLPQDEQWKFFAIELLHVCQQKCGQPKDIDNKIKEIDNMTYRKCKGVSLAYHEVLNTWRNIMAKDAVFEHIEQALQTFNNNIIMQEFRQIKADPLSRKHSINKPDTTLLPWKSNEFKTQPSYVLTYALHESKVESPNAFKGESQQQYLQVSSTGANALPFANDQSLPGPPRLVQSTRLRHKDSSRRQRRRRRTEIIRKRHHLVKSKTKMKLKAEKKVRKIRKEHISLIKKMLAHAEVPINRQEYDKILRDTIDMISKHTNVQREVVLALTFESYCEMSQARNCERYVLYSGKPSLVLDQKQFDCLKFYVEKARSRVIKALNEINVNVDSMYLFITFDGNSVLNTFKRRIPNFKTLLSTSSSSDTGVMSSTDESDTILQSDFQVSDDEELEITYDQHLQTSAGIAQRAICFDQSNCHSNDMLTESVNTVNLSLTTENSLTQKNMLGTIGNVSPALMEEGVDDTINIEESLEGICDPTDSKVQKLDEREHLNDLIEQGTGRTEIRDSAHKERAGTSYSDISIDDLINQIKNELKDSPFL